MMNRVETLSSVETAKIAAGEEEVGKFRGAARKAGNFAKTERKALARDVSGRAAGIIGGAALASPDQSRVVEGAKGLGRNIGGRWGGGALGAAAGGVLKGTTLGKALGAGKLVGRNIGARAGGTGANVETVRKGLKHRKEYAAKKLLEEG